jgi:5-methyltetrahydrofolate--homocysteine methyltransferase
LAALLKRYDLDYNDWLGVWGPKMHYNLQCDFSAMLSPKLFRRFVLPDLRAQSAHMPYALYHLDGPNEILFIDDLIWHHHHGSV